MPVVTPEASIDVLEAARIRIKNIFSNGVKVYLSFSGGKDSLAMADVVLNMIKKGEISADNLEVFFIDEEAIFPCIERIVKDWRMKFLQVGATFKWFCLEVRHFNCFNQLTSDESFICWDHTKKDVWVRQPPKFAIMNDPMLKPRIDTYQDFLRRYCQDGIELMGVRMGESVQRLQNFATMFTAKRCMNVGNGISPLYDWTDKDVWYYLRKFNVEIPEIYLYLYQAGIGKRQLRVSQFFSIDTARSLVKMNEYYPDLMERVVAREPNAYLAALYWDSEMFGRSTKLRKENEQGETKDYKQMLIDLIKNPGDYGRTTHQKKLLKQYRQVVLDWMPYMDNTLAREAYENIIKGDPKSRSYRAFFMKMITRYNSKFKK